VRLISILSDGLLPLVHKEFLQMYTYSVPLPFDPPISLVLIHSVVRACAVSCVRVVCRVCAVASAVG
jgi:hypothetical protein